MKNGIRLGIAGGVFALLVIPAHAASAAPTCQPGSGVKLAGQHLTDTAIKKVKSLQCADLTGADLSGLDLTQVDLTGVKAEHATFRDARLIQADLPGADLKGADLSGADLGQATLTGADLSAANLTNAKIEQADAADVDLTGANLTNVQAAQAHLKGATFDHATIDGGDFTQAELGGASFKDLKGVTNWSLYLGIGAAALFVLLGGAAVMRALGRRSTGDAPAVPVYSSTAPPGMPTSPWTRTGALRSGTALAPAPMATFNPINPAKPKTVGRGLLLGLLGALLVTVGLHLLVGGAIGEFSFAFDTLATATCSGPTCAIGVGSGIAGLIGGVWVALFGGWVMVRA